MLVTDGITYFIFLFLTKVTISSFVNSLPIKFNYLALLLRMPNTIGLIAIDLELLVKY